jgi:hypothetical protein
MQESKFLQELTIWDGHSAPFVLAQSGGEGGGGKREKATKCAAQEMGLSGEKVEWVFEAGGLKHERAHRT